MSLHGALFSAPAWAAAGAEAHGASIAQIVFPLINFLIFIYLIKRFLLPFVRDHLRSRREQVVRAVREAAEAKEKAEAMAGDYRGRLARAVEETKKIKERLRAEGERERSKLLAEAEDLARRLRADGDFLAEQELKAARQEVRAEMARLARETAEELVRRHFTADDQKRLVEEFMREVGESR